MADDQLDRIARVKLDTRLVQYLAKSRVARTENSPSISADVWPSLIRSE